MRMSWSGVCLSLVVGGVWAGESRAAPTSGEAGLAAEGTPGGGFPADGVEFLVVSPGYAVCLSAGRAGRAAVGEGRPCEWAGPGAEQRWRYHDGQLVNVASGDCLLASSLGPCEEAAASAVSYELLAQRLVLDAPRSGAGCFVVGGPSGHLSLGLAPLDSRECGAEYVASKWMLVPLSV